MIGRGLQPLLARLPAERRRQLRRLGQPAYLGALRRTRPLSERYGYDRGQPVDRYYIEAFLHRHKSDVRGHGLEIKRPEYLRQFDAGLTRWDALDIDASNPDATIIADLSAADNVPGQQFDVFILTQTLHMIFDLNGAARHACRLLRRGGVLLATIPAVSRVDCDLPESDFWRMTPLACERLFADIFGGANVQVSSYGNVLSAAAFLMGMAAQDLRRGELDEADPMFPVLVGVRAQRP